MLMFDGVARLAVRWPRRVLVVALLAVLASGALAVDLQHRLDTGGFDDPRSDSSRAAAILDQTFGQGEPNLVLILDAPAGADDPAVTAAGTAYAQRLAGEPGVANVASYWTAGRAPALRGEDVTQTLVVGRVLGETDDVTAWVVDVLPAYTGAVDGFQVRAGGIAVAGHEMTEQSIQDAIKAEAIVFPLALVLLLLVFGSFRAAAIPLIISFAVVLVGMACLWLLTAVTTVSVFVMNMVTILGLGLAIDYSLLLVSRYREELRAGREQPEALRNTLRTAGRTVAFSAVTVAVVLSGITVLPFYSLSSLGWSGVITALVAAAASITVTPALLVAMGGRLERRRFFGREREGRGTDGAWHRLATFVMRRPVVVSLAVVAFLLLLGTPFLGFQGHEVDEQVLPASSEAYRVSTDVRENFDSREQSALSVVATGVAEPGERAALVTGYAERLSTVPGAARVDAETGTYVDGQQVAPPGPQSARFSQPDATYLAVVPAVDRRSEAAQQLARDVRGVDPPFPVLVGGGAAVPIDALDSLYRALPVSVAMVGVAMLILVFLVTGSVVLPLTAVVLSGLSLTATFGALVWIFQDGRLMWLVGDFNATGGTVWVVPVMLFAFAFGLAMDYQIFLLSRIHEVYVRIRDNTAAVALGLERVGRVVTAAAVLIAVVFLGLVASGVTHVKALGLGVALAVLVDATLVRGALLPACMRLTGKWTWWAPGPLARLHRRVGLREGPAGAGDPDQVVGTGSTVRQAELR